MLAETKGNDSKYVKAALKTIADYTKREFEIKEFNTNLSADLIFWLAEEQIPSSFLAQLKPNSKVVAYVNGKVKPINSIIQLSNTTAVDLYQKSEAAIKPGEVIWKDGFGEPLLIKQKDKQINYFYFYSKFNPQWSDLVWGEHFVDALLPIVLGDQQIKDFGFEQNENDQRVVVESQNLLLNNKAHNAPMVRIESITLVNYLWILALLILIVERILSFRKTKLNDAKN